ncbi:MAG: hypothetical protein M1826_004227 [Phylliscum demangeonii]|nr:MAG: hypothetical protein M1826_004227 [Phylliscum demangeonii]
MDLPEAASNSNVGAPKDGASQASQNSHTAAEFIDLQLQLEADAREALPYAFDTCTQPLGPLKQLVFSCLTCRPLPAYPLEPYAPAGVCYSCSIACHGEHDLVELFSKRHFVCDCGTSRLPATSPCALRINPATGCKGGVHSEVPAAENQYNQNFQDKFCSCRKPYEADKENGTMFQCLGLGSVHTGGCGEDWYHPGCVVGLGPDWYEEQKEKRPPKKNEKEKEGSLDDNGDAEVVQDQDEGEGEDEDEDETPMPPGFPDEDDFDAFLCWKCVDAHPWLKRYAGSEGFLPPVFLRSTPEGDPSSSATVIKDNIEESIPSDGLSKKRSFGDDDNDTTSLSSAAKRLNKGTAEATPTLSVDQSSKAPVCKYQKLPPPPPGSFSLFLKDDFRDHICHCADCFPNIASHAQLSEEEETYEPPLSVHEDGAAGGSSVGTGSILDRGERALSNMDRVKAIEGVMVYNDLKEKVKSFLKPFAESGQPVGAEDVKQYFEKLRGDAEAIKASKLAALHGAETDGGDYRRRQSGY